MATETLTLELPIRTMSEANMRESWQKKYRRKLAQQNEVEIEWRNAFGRRKVKLPCIVTLTRIGPRALDSDNLAGSGKHVRDSIARMIGVDDGSAHIQFVYKQIANGKRKYGVRIEVEST